MVTMDDVRRYISGQEQPPSWLIQPLTSGGFLSGNTGDLGSLWYNLTQNQELPDFLKWYLSMLANTFGMSLAGQKPQVEQTTDMTQPTQGMLGNTNISSSKGNTVPTRNFPYLNQTEFYGNIGYKPPSVDWSGELKWLAQRGLFRRWTSEPYVQKILTDFPQYLKKQFGVNITPTDLIGMAEKYGGGLLGLHKAMPELASRINYLSNPRRYHYSGYTASELTDRGYGGLMHSIVGTTPKYKTEADVVKHLNEVDRLISKVKDSLKRNKNRVGSLLGGRDNKNKTTTSTNTTTRSVNPNARHWG